MFQDNIRAIYPHHSVQKFTPRLLMHHVASVSIQFPPLVIFVFECLSCHQCKKMDPQNYSQCWNGFKCIEDGKPKNVQDKENFAEEQWPVLLLRTNKGCINNYHKTLNSLISANAVFFFFFFSGLYVKYL